MPLTFSNVIGIHRKPGFVRVRGLIFWTACLIVLDGLVYQRVCFAQRPSLEYDYYSLAVTSASNSAAEAAKLSDIPQRVRLLVRAARILPASQRDDAVRLLEGALRDLKDWMSKDDITWFQIREGRELRNDVLALLATLDSQRAELAQKAIQADDESTSRNGATSPKQPKNLTSQFSERRANAEQFAKLALSLVNTDTEKAAALVAQSLQGGTVSPVLFEIVQKLLEQSNRTSLERIESVIAQQLSQNVTLDPFSVTYAVSVFQADKDLPAAAKGAFVGFIIRSVQAWSGAVKEPGIDSSFINSGFTMFSISVRPVILRSAPDQLLAFDLALNEAAPFVPEKTRSRLQAFQPETFAEPRDRLNDILKDVNTDKRDLRLIRFASQILRGESEGVSKTFDLAAEAINGLSDADAKTAFTDLLTIARINEMLKQHKLVDAQRLADSISAAETQAWALLSLSAVSPKTERTLSFALLNKALEVLEKTSPGTMKAELALRASAMLAKDDPSRALDILSTAARYANSSPDKMAPPAKPAVGFGLDASIGNSHIRLGVFPEALDELSIDPSLADLGTADWFRANQIVDGIRNAALRLQLKLHFAAAVIAKGEKPRRKT